MEVSTQPDTTTIDGEKPLPVDLSHYFSEVAKRRLPSKIKAVYKFFQIPGIKNLAGGLPNAQFFPFDTLEAQAAKPERWTPSPNHPGEPAPSASSRPETATHIAVPKASAEEDITKRIDLSTALQYGLADGYAPLLSWVRQFTLENLHPSVPYRGGVDVAMTCGSTDGFSKTLSVFVDAWTDGVHDISDRPGLLVEPFVYGLAISESIPRGMQVVPVQADGKGMLAKGPGGLEDVLGSWDVSKGRRPHVIYTVTQGHNPTGIVIPLERKKEIYAVCSKYDVIIIEDEPYWFMQFPSAATAEADSRGLPTPQQPALPKPTASSGYPFLDSLAPSYVSIDTDGRVVRLDTFSKTVAPGCRLGWITAQPAVIEKYIRVTETSTQQPSGFVQSLVAELVIGSQPSAKAAFIRACASGNGNGNGSRFTGWRMDGWIRWLEGLRGAYERRMVRLCRILDAGAYEISSSEPDPTSNSDSDWGVVTKTKLIDFAWPRGGMFVWLRVHFERHPLFQTPGETPGTIIDGPALSTALTIFLTTKPYLVLVGGGSLFSATEEIRKSAGWAYLRLCFAAESDENIDASARKFVEGLHRFWRIKSAKEIQKLIDEMPRASEVDEMTTGFARLGGWLGC